ncbi:MAG: hypothetical protein QOE36_2913 [Gaiellaceae bacterium]|nr:hypothetical protein [Gaiellaceae bacterium]
MTERDTDIEFDFFDDEPATEEATQRRRLPRVGPPRGPQGPMRPSTGVTPLMRLIGLIAFAILIVVLLVFWVQSCAGNSKKQAYETYMKDVSVIAQSSQQTGKDLNALLTTQGEKESTIITKLLGFRQRENQNLEKAKATAPPGPLRDADQHLIEALQFRVNGLQGLAGAFSSTRSSKNATAAGNALATQARRLLASDVIWEDLFRAPATNILSQEGITGVAVPGSTFLENPDLATARSLQPVWQRVHGATTGTTGTSNASCPCGTGLVSVKVLPAGKVLSSSGQNTVTASTNLAFEVTVKNTGNSQVVRVAVVLTIEKSPKNLVRRQVIPLMNAGDEKTITFRDIDVSGAFGVKTFVKVNVEPVPNETKLDNNSAQYQVFFSI